MTDHEGYKEYKQFAEFVGIKTICCNCKQLFSSKNKLHKHLKTKCFWKYPFTRLATRAAVQAVTHSSTPAKTHSLTLTEMRAPTPTEMRALTLTETPPVTSLSTALATSAPSHAPSVPTAILQAIFSAPTTPPASMPSTTSMPPTTLKITKAFSSALPTPLTTPTPPTTPKIAKPTCAMLKPVVYMTINDLFWKFVSRTTQHQHATEFRPQSLQTPLPSSTPYQATIAHSFATFSAFKKCS